MAIAVFKKVLQCSLKAYHKFDSNHEKSSHDKVNVILNLPIVIILKIGVTVNESRASSCSQQEQADRPIEYTPGLLYGLKVNHINSNNIL